MLNARLISPILIHGLMMLTGIMLYVYILRRKRRIERQYAKGLGEFLLVCFGLGFVAYSG